MSADIWNRDVVTLGSNTEAWWGSQAGKLFAGRLSPRRAQAEGVAAFHVEEHPVILSGQVLEGSKGLVAVNGTDKWPLSVVGQDYGVMQNETFWGILEHVYQSRPVVETAGTLGNGKRVWALISAGEHSIQAGDKVLEYDLWVNSFDGSYALSCLGTVVRVVCQNTLTMAVGKARKRLMSVKHTINVNQTAASAVATLTASRDARLVELAKMRRLAELDMSFDEAVQFFRDLMGVTSVTEAHTRTLNNVDQLTDLFSNGKGNVGETRWDALNAVTEFSDHHRTLRVGDGNRAEARFTSALLGSGADLKSRAFEMLVGDWQG